MNIYFLFQRRQIINLLTLLTFALALLGFLLEVKVRDSAVLLLFFVILGTSFDFLNYSIGVYLKNKTVLLIFAKARFSLLNFGILFTPLSAAFILSKFSTSQLCNSLANHYLYWLIFSLVSGGLFLFARYSLDEEKGVMTFKLDRNDRFTSYAFIIRRVLLLCSLIIALITVLEGLKTEFAIWSVLFGVFFIATIPLHILHKLISSMVVELFSLIILLYGATKMYLP